MKLFIVGKFSAGKGGEWEFQGVFDSEEKACDACTSALHFVGPATLNRSIEEDPVEWPGVYYPRQQQYIAA